MGMQAQDSFSSQDDPSNIHSMGKSCLAPEGTARAQTLQRWSVIGSPAALASAGLLFEPIDGNPRHGILALVVDGALHSAGILEVFERQGLWMAIPGAPWALAKAQHAFQVLGAMRVPRSRIAGTPDQRFIFFNTWLHGVLVTQVERRDIPTPTFS